MISCFLHCSGIAVQNETHQKPFSPGRFLHRMPGIFEAVRNKNPRRAGAQKKAGKTGGLAPESENQP